jgi:hypothetical protein
MGWNLRNETIANSQEGVNLQRAGETHLLLEHPDDQSSHDVDQCDNDSRDGIAAHKFAGSIHCAVEIRLFFDLRSSIPGLDLGDKPCIQVCVNTHLLPRHRVKGKSGSHLRNSASTLGDDHKINNHQNCKDD